jgi:hypothetical protein
MLRLAAAAAVAAAAAPPPDFPQSCNLTLSAPTAAYGQAVFEATNAHCFEAFTECIVAARTAGARPSAALTVCDSNCDAGLERLTATCGSGGATLCGLTGRNPNATALRAFTLRSDVCVPEAGECDRAALGGWWRGVLCGEEYWDDPECAISVACPDPGMPASTMWAILGGCLGGAAALGALCLGVRLLQKRRAGLAWYEKEGDDRFDELSDGEEGGEEGGVGRGGDATALAVPAPPPADDDDDPDQADPTPLTFAAMPRGGGS